MLSQTLLPDAKPPMKQDPAKFMLQRAKSALPEERRQRIPESLDKAAEKALQMGYGMTSGILYSLLGRREPSAVLDGTLLGVGVWAAGYLGWLPAADLMPPITEQEPEQVAVPLVQHLVFGVAVVAAYQGIRALTD